MNIIFFCCYFAIFDFRIRRKGTVNPLDQTSAIYTSILTDPITRTCLFYHMIELHQQENLLFWEDITRFKTIAKSADSSQLLEYCQRIQNRYISDSSPYQINIAHDLRNSIESRIDSGDVDADIFDAAYDEIANLIRQNCCSSFLLSKHANTAKQMLQWFKGFEDLTPELKEAIKKKISHLRIDNLHRAQSFTGTGTGTGKTNTGGGGSATRKINSKRTTNLNNTQNSINKQYTMMNGGAVLQHVFSGLAAGNNDKVLFSVFSKDEEETAEAILKLDSQHFSGGAMGSIAGRSINNKIIQPQRFGSSKVTLSPRGVGINGITSPTMKAMSPSRINRNLNNAKTPSESKLRKMVSVEQRNIGLSPLSFSSNVMSNRAINQTQDVPTLSLNVPDESSQPVETKIEVKTETKAEPVVETKVETKVETNVETKAEE